MSKAVVVLGMHRSGTSLVALILKELGINMGDKTLVGGSSNPFGHEEDLAFFDLNERFLRKAKGDWDFPPSKADLDLVAKHFDEEIGRLITDRYNRSNLWGWKEPRTALLFKYYRAHLSNYQVIHVTRSFDRIAASLWKRDKMPIRKSRDLCDSYNERLNESLVDIVDKVLRISYEDLVADGSAVINNLIDFLGITVEERQYEKALYMIKSQREIKKYSRVAAGDKIKVNAVKALTHPFMACKYVARKCYRFFRYRFGH